MSKAIQTIDLFRWSEPDEQRRVKKLGPANAKEVFEKLNTHLKENNLLPDEYFLFSESNFTRFAGELPTDTADITYDVNYGGSEGIYLDINIRTANSEQVHFATGKTLGENTEDFLRMSRIGAECALMLNSGGYKIQMNQTPETAFKLNSEEETIYSIIDKNGNDTLIKRTTLNPESDPTPFIIASGVKTQNGLIEWDSGRYFSSFNSAVKEFQKSMTEAQMSEHIHSDKIVQINELLAGIQDQNDIYSNSSKNGYFDYDSVITALQQAQQTIDSSLRYPRPENLPEDMIWSEKPSAGFDDDFDPFVYDGSISPEDFFKVQGQFVHNGFDDLEYALESEISTVSEETKSPCEQLIKKASAEFNEYIAEVKKSGAEKAIESAYEISTKKDILIMLEDLTDKEAEQLLKLDRPVNSVYQEWISNSSNPGTGLLRDTLEEAFFAKQESNSQLPFPNVGIKPPTIPPPQGSLKR